MKHVELLNHLIVLQKQCFNTVLSGAAKTLTDPMIGIISPEELNSIIRKPSILILLAIEFTCKLIRKTYMENDT